MKGGVYRMLTFFRDNKKAPEMYNTSLIIMFLRRIFLFLIF